MFGYYRLLLQFGQDLRIVIDVKKMDFEPVHWDHYLGMLVDAVQERLYPLNSLNTSFQGILTMFLLPVLPKPPSRLQ